MTSEVEDFLMAGGVRSATFKNVGDKVMGYIVSSEVRDQTDIQTGEVKRFPDGNPMRQVVITIVTEPLLHDDDDDDGIRRIYVKNQMLAALREALRKAGSRGPADEGKISVEYIGDGVAKKGFNPPKQYRVKYAEPERRTPVDGVDTANDDDAYPPF